MAVEFWIGRAGDLRLLQRNPGLGMNRTSDRRSQAHQLLAGGQVVDRAPRGSRSWGMTFPMLSTTEWEQLYALYDGQYGPGPYWLLDPTMTNLLTPDQASSGSSRGDTASWSAAGAGETLAISTALVDGGSATLLWTLPAAPAGGVLLSPHPSGTHRATSVGWEWTYWARLRLASTSPDTAVDVTVSLIWYDSAGAVLSTSTSSATTLGTGAWSRVTITATAPASAVRFAPKVTVTSGTVGAGGAQVHVGQSQLARGADDATWHPGLGYPLVTIAAQDDSIARYGRFDSSWTLVEVG